VKRRISFCSLVGIILLVLSCSDSYAATFNVANGDVTGPNGLQNAITSANGNVQDDTIELATNGTYTLTNVTGSLPQIGPDGGHKLTIHGNGATLQRDTVTAPQFRIFTIQSGTNVTISSLTINNGNPGNFHGGAIYVNTGESAASTLIIQNCIFNNNRGDYGGAIFNDGYNDPSFPAHTATLIVTNSTFSNNHGSQYGGAIWNESGSIIMIVSNCTFSGNTAVRSAGAVQVDGSNGTITAGITSCTFSGNTAGDYGGAVGVDGFAGSATLTVNNCTFDQNKANWGGGIASDGSSGSALLSVSNCTFNGNLSLFLGDAIYLSQTGSGTTSLLIGNTILASGDPDFNLSIDNMSGGTATVTSRGYNLSDDSGGGFLSGTADQINTDPMLDPAGLKNNGGATLTIALQATSPAIDQGKRNTILSTSNDQRGQPRPFDDPNVADAAGGDSSDIGAYEADVRIIGSLKIVNDFQLTFTTILGHTYEIQHAPSPVGPWTQVAGTTPPPPIAGTGGIVTVLVTNAFVPSPQFYRAHQLP
jgi:predicted outer membrane repeat protein